MAINGVLRPGHVAIRVREMGPAVRHYTEVLGLIETARDAQGRVYLKAWDEHDHHSVVLREATDPGMDYMGWRVDSATTLKKLAADVEGSGLASEMTWLPAGEHPMTGERFRFTIPTGHAMELFAEKEKVGNGLPTTNPDAWPDGLRGMAPSRFDHCPAIRRRSGRKREAVHRRARLRSYGAGCRRTREVDDRGVFDLFDQAPRCRLHSSARKGKIPSRLLCPGQLG